MELVIGFLALIALLLAALVGYSLIWAGRAERAVPPRGHFTQISTGRLHYVDRGTGPAILLIHGLGGNLGNFDLGIIGDLARDHRVIAVDRPGMGYSDRPADACASPRAQARQMIEVMDRLEISAPLVVGHSLGGAIAMAMAVDAPERIRGLALLAPLTLPGQEPPEPFRGMAIESDLARRIASYTIAVPNAVRNPGLVAKYVFGPEEIPADYPLRGGGLLSLRPRNMVHVGRDYIASGDRLDELARAYPALTVPIRVLYGQDDRLLSPCLHGHKLVARCPQIGLKLVPGGHMIPLTQPKLCADFIRKASEDMKGRMSIRRASPEVYR